MDIGQKLRQACLAVHLTQEEAAEKIGVSRQTISNWENKKSYPDIVKVIALSDLYSISLDCLLKEDADMIDYLERCTNTVKSQQKISRRIIVFSYLVIWSVLVLLFWAASEAGMYDIGIFYSLVTFYIALPFATVVCSVFIGKDGDWKGLRWMMALFFGLMYMLAEYLTFSLANMRSFDKWNMPEISLFVWGIALAIAGMGIGLFIDRHRKKKAILTEE